MRLRGLRDIPEVVYRGPLAPSERAMGPLSQGAIKTIELESAGLGKARRIAIYTPNAPPSTLAGYPMILMADGQNAPEYAAILDRLIGEGVVQPILLVGVWSGVDEADKTPWGLRGREYIKGSAACDDRADFCDERGARPFAREFVVSDRPVAALPER